MTCVQCVMTSCSIYIDICKWITARKMCWACTSLSFQYFNLLHLWACTLYEQQMTTWNDNILYMNSHIFAHVDVSQFITLCVHEITFLLCHIQTIVRIGIVMGISGATSPKKVPFRNGINHFISMSRRLHSIEY